MMNILNSIKSLRGNHIAPLIIFLQFILNSCSKLVEVDGSYTSLNYDNVYSNDATATSVLTGIYAGLSRENATLYLYSFTLTNISFYCGLSSDEFTLFKTGDLNFNAYYTNSLSNNSNINGSHWNVIYSNIFTANSAIEALNNNTSISPAVSKQLLGEAKFFRAFSYFYLVNLFGDVPLVLSSNPNVNSQLSRENESKVYLQIINDLIDAGSLLSEDFLDGSLKNSVNERVRPTKWAAWALLSRVYLYNHEYDKAEDFATKIIDKSELFHLTLLNDVFLKNSYEAIWQLQSVSNGNYSNTGDGSTYVLTDGPNTSTHPVYLNNNLISNFEQGDLRLKNWIDTSIVGSNVYYFPYKYKADAQSLSTTEYAMMLRLAEQYLIRSEARAQLGKLDEAMDDLNAIRNRAGLSPFSTTTKENLLNEILHERRVELFTEWGNRWFDLKRTGNVNLVMNQATLEKGGNWNANWQLYPILLSELRLDPFLNQNPGY